jgi:MinD-like ATPase involved in chromosome partitioning or flagellar assembly
MPRPIEVAIACPEREAELWATVEDPAFTVDGRRCSFAGPCDSIAELREALARRTADVVLVSASLNAIPFETLRDLLKARCAVVLASDAESERWRDFPVRVLAADPGRDELARAIRDSLNGTGSQRTRATASRRSASTRAADVPQSLESGNSSKRVSNLIAVTKPYRGEGVTLAAASLAFAAGVVEKRTVLVDANTRVGSVEFHVGANPALNMAQLVRRAEEVTGQDASWDALLASELQAMGPPSGAHLLCGITRVAQRTQLSDASFKALVGALKERFRYVFLATSGSGWTVDDSPVDQAALNLADQILLVVRPDVEGLTLARRALHNSPLRERVHLILNEVGLPDQVSRRDAEAKLNLPVAAILPFDPWKVAEARARNRPVVCQRGCRLATPLLDLAGRLANGRVELAPDEQPKVSPWWQRLPLAVTGALR